jgi:hypothetical protein
MLMQVAVALPAVMPLDQIETGMRGTCLTIFEGELIEPFDFEVKGVMRGFLGPKRHVVLIRLRGEKPEYTGVVAGMSGSPCSINGKLVGALAYAFANFAKEPIAGITPFGDMLEVQNQPPAERPWRLDRSALAQNDKTGSKGTTDAAWEMLRQGSAPPLRQSDGLVPIATPLMMAGLLPAVREHFAPWLQSEGFVPVAGGIGSKGVPGKKSLEPGGAVAALLVRGDVEVAATGTVTSVDGKNVLAFGHPFLGAGLVSVPMARASILNTMVSELRSFKMAQVHETVGEVTQDRLTAIGGVLGPSPAMVPVHGTIEAAGSKRDFSFELARDQTLSPRFGAIALSNALLGGVAETGRGTLRLDATIKIRGMDDLHMRSVYAAQQDPNLLMYAAIDVARTFGTMWDTPFGPPPDLALEVNAKLEADPVIEWIEAVHVDRAMARPGDTIEVGVRLRRDDGPQRVERFGIKVPTSWAGQEVDLIAVGGDLAQRVAESLAGDPRPVTLAQVRRWLENRRENGYLYLMAARSGAGMRAEVDSFDFLPPSMVALLSGDANKQRHNRGLAWEERRKQPGVLVSGVLTTLKVLPY